MQYHFYYYYVIYEDSTNIYKYKNLKLIKVKNKRLKTIKEIIKEVEEPKYDYVEKFAKISDDKKSLLLRIPQEIRLQFSIKAGDKIRFYAKFKEKKPPKLKIELIKC